MIDYIRMVMRNLNQSRTGNSRLRFELAPASRRRRRWLYKPQNSCNLLAFLQQFSSVEETRHQFGNLCSWGRVCPAPCCTSSQDLGKHVSFSLNGKHSHVLWRVSETCCSWWGFRQQTCGYFSQRA